MILQQKKFHEKSDFETKFYETQILNEKFYNVSDFELENFISSDVKN